MSAERENALTEAQFEARLRAFAAELISLARAEALEEAAQACEAHRDHILSVQSGREGDPVDINLRQAAYLGADQCAAAIRGLIGAREGGSKT